ncbi:MAG: type II secretion system F family protein [Candidatus Woesearchaeota archaeon]|jgi:flagellar protein FlaJ
MANTHTVQHGRYVKKSSFNFKQKYFLGIFAGIFVLLFDFIFLKKSIMFVPTIGISIVVMTSQMWLDYFAGIRREKELEEKFPEFVRNLVESIKSGLSVSKAIIHVSQINYGALTPHIRKLANQVTWAVPLHKALANFANGTENKMIKRAIATVIEAKESGGSLEEVLETITNSVVEIKKIKDKRRAEIFSQCMQSYFIFFVFLAVMVVIQNILMPYVGNLGQVSTGSMQGSALEKSAELDFTSIPGFVMSVGAWFVSLNGIFVMVAVIQGLFAGLVMGKLSEGNIKYGFKHSFILVVLGFMIMTFSQGLTIGIL